MLLGGDLMAILSKTDLIKRIMIGEILINDEQDTKKLIRQCLIDIEKNPEKAKDLLKQHFEKVTADPKNLSKRRLKMKKYIEGKATVDIQNDLGKNAGLKNLEGIRDKKGKIDLPILIDDIDYEKCVKEPGANYDLRLGEKVYVTSERIPKKLTAMGADGVISIEPGEFGLLMTHEYLFVPPDLIGFISVRLTFKQKGLVNISGFHVDPGFYGRLMFAVFNAGPNDVPLRYREPVFMIMFNTLTKPLRKVEKNRWQDMRDIPIESISGLRGTSISVRNLDERVKKLEMLYPVVITGIAGLVVSVIAWLLTH